MHSIMEEHVFLISFSWICVSHLAASEKGLAASYRIWNDNFPCSCTFFLSLSRGHFSFCHSYFTHVSVCYVFFFLVSLFSCLAFQFFISVILSSSFPVSVFVVYIIFSTRTIKINKLFHACFNKEAHIGSTTVPVRLMHIWLKGSMFVKQRTRGVNERVIGS